MPCNTCNRCNQSPCRCGGSSRYDSYGYGGGYSYGYGHTGSCGGNCGGSSRCGCGGYGGGYYNRPRLASFTFRKLSTLNGIPLPNAVFQLFINGVVYATAVSDRRGVVRFSCLPPGVYAMTEVVSPQGFATSTATYTVAVSPNGFVTIDGQPAFNFIITNAPLPTTGFSVIKTDATTGAALAGGTFTLSQNGTVVRIATSAADGVAQFSTLPAGTYTLTETVAPAGYTINPVSYNLVVAADGTVTVDGQTVTSLTITNAPTVTGALAFTLLATDTGLGIAGAQFQIISQGVSAATATTDANGNASFQMIPVGTYTFRQVSTVSGYAVDPAVRNVVVAENGTVTVDGQPAAGLIIYNSPTVA